MGPFFLGYHGKVCIIQPGVDKRDQSPSDHRQFRSSTPRQSIRHTSFPARLRIPIQRRMDHLSALADWPFHGQPHRSSCRCLLRILPYGVVRPQEDFRRVCHYLFGIHVHPVLCEIAACAFGGRTTWRLGIVASDMIEQRALTD